MKKEKFNCFNSHCSRTHKSKSQASACCSKDNKRKQKFNRNKDY